MLDMNNIPMAKIIEMELDTGFMLSDLFDEKDGKENPWAKLVFAYLNILSGGKSITWQEMKELSPNKIAELSPIVVDADPKDVSANNN